MIFGPIAKLRRAFEFGRHIPFAKLARRAELNVRRRIRDRLKLEIRARVLVTRAERFQPLFPPRIGILHSNPTNLVFTFIGQSKTHTRTEIDWCEGAAEQQLWCMNLHYMEYLEEADDALFEELLKAWIEANPGSRPGSWKDSWNSYALSIRTVVWMQQLAMRAGRLTVTIVHNCTASLARQLVFLENNLETDIGGNHLIKNIKALIWASAFFDGPEAARWRSTGLKLLSGEIVLQILGDGGHYERSPAYHCQVFADLLEIRQVLGPGALDDELDKALRRMAQYAADLAHPDGAICLFNDAGMTMAYSPDECLAAYAGFFGTRPSPRSLFCFEAAGYYGSRSEKTYFVADCGPIAPDDLVAHGHGDILSFEWSAGGDRIIVDQGVYEYVAGERRTRSRSASSHNTLCFEGADQADFFGAFRCGRRPGITVLSHKTREDGFSLEGTHDGFRGLPGAPRHVRKFDVGPDWLVIHDRIAGRTSASASVGFLLHPDVEAAAIGNTAIIRCGGLAIEAVSTLPIECEDAVWWPDMGRERPTKRLVLLLRPGVMEAQITFRVTECSRIEGGR